MSDKHQIPEERVFLYYLGNFLAVVGVLMFFSVIVLGVLSVSGGERTYSHPSVQLSPGVQVSPEMLGMPATYRARPQAPNPMVALAGMGLMIVGGILSGIGKAGLAGSGIVLDPKRQREELKPWSKMTGGMINDALEEVDIVKSISASGREVVKVRCPACRTLNDEDAKFCDQCGQPL